MAGSYTATAPTAQPGSTLTVATMRVITAPALLLPASSQPAAAAWSGHAAPRIRLGEQGPSSSRWRPLKPPAAARLSRSVTVSWPPPAVAAAAWRSRASCSSRSASATQRSCGGSRASRQVRQPPGDRGVGGGRCPHGRGRGGWPPGLLGNPDVAEPFGAAQPYAFPGQPPGQVTQDAGRAGHPVGGAGDRAEPRRLGQPGRRVPARPCHWPGPAPLDLAAARSRPGRVRGWASRGVDEHRRAGQPDDQPGVSRPGEAGAPGPLARSGGRGQSGPFVRHLVLLGRPERTPGSPPRRSPSGGPPGAAAGGFPATGHGRGCRLPGPSRPGARRARTAPRRRPWPSPGRSRRG